MELVIPKRRDSRMINWLRLGVGPVHISDRYFVKAKGSEGTGLLNLCLTEQLRGMIQMNVNVTKSIPIEFKWVVDAYGKVRKGGKAVGIDEESWTDFEKDVEKNLYVIWNRMASGSYLPQAVKEKEIPKKDGTTRKLGIPTLRDRIAQQVVKHYMEVRIDKLFHPNSYGYRPMKSAHQALKAVQENCYKKDWVIDMDISKFFDEIDHEIMLKAVQHVLPEKWVSLYVKRWLEASVQDEYGNLKEKQGKGTPQGGVISPILANLYLHFTLDMWLSKYYSDVSFVRYADDVVLHCQTKQRAEEVLASIRKRLLQVKLTVKESKTKIAYCKDYKRYLEHAHVSFEFLGFSFKPLPAKSPYKKKLYPLFRGEISSSSRQKIIASIRDEKVLRNTQLEIKDIAVRMNPKLRGWINYYGLMGKRQLQRTFYRLEERLVKWIGNKYKIGYKLSFAKLAMMKKENPNLFYHWETMCF